MLVGGVVRGAFEVEWNESEFTHEKNEKQWLIGRHLSRSVFGFLFEGWKFTMANVFALHALQVQYTRVIKYFIYVKKSFADSLESVFFGILNFLLSHPHGNKKMRIA